MDAITTTSNEAYGIVHNKKPSKRVYDIPVKVSDQQRFATEDAQAQHLQVYLETKYLATTKSAEPAEYGAHAIKSKADKDVQKKLKRENKPKQSSKHEGCISDLFFICLAIISMMMSITVIVCVALLTTNDTRLNNDSISGD